MQARKEMQDYVSVPMNEGEKILILAGETIDSSLFGDGEKTSIQLSYDKASAWLIRTVIIRWAVNGLSTNGRIMKLQRNTYQVNDFIERFLSEMGKNERRALSIRPFVTEYNILKTLTKIGVFYQVTGSGIQAELAYALLFSSLHGIVYSLSSELLAWNSTEMFRLHEDSMYTFLTQNNRTLYESRHFARLFKDAPFLLIGEHKIFEKLRLSELIGLDKKQREWGSEPAKRALLMTKLVTY